MHVSVVLLSTPMPAMQRRDSVDVEESLSKLLSSRFRKFFAIIFSYFCVWYETNIKEEMVRAI
jgi:hypothetical protein